MAAAVWCSGAGVVMSLPLPSAADIMAQQASPDAAFGDPGAGSCDGHRGVGEPAAAAPPSEAQELPQEESAVTDVDGDDDADEEPSPCASAAVSSIFDAPFGEFSPMKTSQVGSRSHPSQAAPFSIALKDQPGPGIFFDVDDVVETTPKRPRRMSRAQRVVVATGWLPWPVTPDNMMQPVGSPALVVVD